MVQEISDFDGYIDFINEIAADPRYADPHFQYNKDNLFGAPRKKDQRIFAVKRGGKTEGLFVWLILHDEKYVEMMIGLTQNKDAFMEMFSFLEAQHQGYQFDFVLNPKNDAICGRLRELGAVFGKEQQKMVHKKAIRAASTKQVELLSPEWEEQYLCVLSSGRMNLCRKFLLVEEKEYAAYDQGSGKRIKTGRGIKSRSVGPTFGQCWDRG